MNIYKTTNLINNKIYIGKEEKYRKGYLGSGKLIKNAILKYGVENFKKEIIDTAKNRKELREKEKYWISFYKSNNRDIGYNISIGGDGGQLIDNEKLSENAKKLWSNPEYRKKQSQSRRGRINWNCGKKGIYTKESRKKMSQAKIGKKLTNEHKDSIRKSNYKRKYVTVKCVETNEIFNSVLSAIRHINLSVGYKLKLIKPGIEIKLGNFTYIKIKNGGI